MLRPNTLSIQRFLPHTLTNTHTHTHSPHTPRDSHRDLYRPMRRLLRASTDPAERSSSSSSSRQPCSVAADAPPPQPTAWHTCRRTKMPQDDQTGWSWSLPMSQSGSTLASASSRGASTTSLRLVSGMIRSPLPACSAGTMASLFRLAQFFLLSSCCYCCCCCCSRSV